VQPNAANRGRGASGVLRYSAPRSDDRDGRRGRGLCGGARLRCGIGRTVTEPRRDSSASEHGHNDSSAHRNSATVCPLVCQVDVVDCSNVSADRDTGCQLVHPADAFDTDTDTDTDTDNFIDNFIDNHTDTDDRDTDTDTDTDTFIDNFIDDHTDTDCQLVHPVEVFDCGIVSPDVEADADTDCQLGYPADVLDRGTASPHVGQAKAATGLPSVR
jgi:hypothetical protein